MTWKYELSFGNVPTSVNQRRGEHWAAASKRKTRWQDDFFIALLHEKVPKKLSHVHATAVISLPKNRRRDEGNYRDVLEKALGDALQLGGWLADDTPEYFTFGAVTFESGKAETRVTLEVE